jgi:hypothetical protein
MPRSLPSHVDNSGAFLESVDRAASARMGEAVRSAKDYLSMTHFSRAGLIQQLSSKYGSGYTVAQATYAANHVGL